MDRLLIVNYLFIYSQKLLEFRFNDENYFLKLIEKPEYIAFTFYSKSKS